VDVDGDGVANWVEILAGTNPSSPDESVATHERIQRVISCNVCHTSVSQYAAPGEDRAPHNAFGDALEELGDQGGARRGARRGRGREQNRGADRDGPSEPIEPRLKRLKGRDTDRDKVKNWDEISVFHHPADPDDTPDEASVAAARERLRARRKSDEGFGKVHER
jgi:hypothetical protein